MNMDLKNSILTAKDLPVRKVETPEWESTPVVYVRMLTGPELIAQSEFSEGDNDNADEDAKLAEQYIWRWAAYVLCDEDGNRLYGDDELMLLAGKNPHVLRRIVDDGQDHNDTILSFAGDVESAIRRGAKRGT